MQPFQNMMLSRMENEEQTVRPGSLKAWLLAARPKTLTGAATPVMIAMAMAWADMQAHTTGMGTAAVAGEGREFSITVAVLCFLFAFIMQIDANFVNDYFDFKKGTDDVETRLGPKRACAQGWIAPRAMFKAIIITTLIACAVGLPLVFFGGVEMILVGLLCVVFCFLYTTCLSYMGMGDVLVLLFFGIVPVCVPYYLQTGTVTWQVFLASVACGLAIDALLIVNNYRDRDTDRVAGKNTIVVRIGARATEWLYFAVGLVAYAVSIPLAMGGYPFATAFPIIYLSLHIHTWRKLIAINHGRELNACLGETARNIFIFGLSLSLSLLL